VSEREIEERDRGERGRWSEWRKLDVAHVEYSSARTCASLTRDSASVPESESPPPQTHKGACARAQRAHAPPTPPASPPRAHARANAHTNTANRLMTSAATSHHALAHAHAHTHIQGGSAGGQRAYILSLFGLSVSLPLSLSLSLSLSLCLSLSLSLSHTHTRRTARLEAKRLMTSAASAAAGSGRSLVAAVCPALVFCQIGQIISWSN
jgi:hypothetical protein